jgi:hypothetical protein
MNYKIITAANDSYILTLLDFLNHHINIGIDLENIIVYNLGLNEINLQKVKYILNNKSEIKNFDYKEYPEYVNLNKFNGLYCSYAFKPIIIYNEANSNNNTNIPIIWLDSACRATIETLNKIVDSISLYGFYCPIGNYEKTIESIELNHPQTLNLLGITKNQHINELQTRLACVCGVKYNTFNGNIILNDWYKYSLEKKFIMPDGSSRNNHRQDQTVLSALMFLHEKKYNFTFEKSFFNLTCWIKCDKSIEESNYNKFSLLQRNNRRQLGSIYANSFDEAVKICCERKQMTLQLFLEEFIIV